MNSGALHECVNPYCGNYAVADGYCRAHLRELRGEHRERVAGPTGANLTPANRRFRWLRHAYLTRHPLCAVCHEPASVLDHVQPHRGDRALFWDQANWQPLCFHCHARKTAREVLHSGRGEFRDDGVDA